MIPRFLLIIIIIIIIITTYTYNYTRPRKIYNCRWQWAVIVTTSQSGDQSSSFYGFEYFSFACWEWPFYEVHLIFWIFGFVLDTGDRCLYHILPPHLITISSQSRAPTIIWFPNKGPRLKQYYNIPNQWYQSLFIAIHRHINKMKCSRYKQLWWNDDTEYFLAGEKRFWKSC